MRATITALAVIALSVAAAAGPAIAAGSPAVSNVGTSQATYQSTVGGNQSF